MITFYHFQALLIDKRSSLLEDPTVIDSIVFFKNYTRLEKHKVTVSAVTALLKKTVPVVTLSLNGIGRAGGFACVIPLKLLS